jgi:hypothetical protein
MGGGWRFVFLAFAASRLFFLGAGALGTALLPEATPGGDPREPAGVLSYWAHWDGAWYSLIATAGYEARAPESYAFFPLYPLLVRAGAALGGGPALWGVAISTLSTLCALYFLYRIAQRLWDERAARAATLVLAFFPTAFFLNAVYTEGLFLALATGAVWAALVHRSLLPAGVLGLLAALTRNSGVLVLLPLAWEWWRGREEFGWRGALPLALPPLGLGVYAAYLWSRTGDPLAFVAQQEAYWGRELRSPPATLSESWRAAGEGLPYLAEPRTLFFEEAALPALAASNVWNLAALGLAVALLGAGLFLLPPGLYLYALATVILPVLSPSPALPLLGLPRFLLGAFPLFLVLGAVLARSRWALGVWLALGVGGGACLAALFASWRWVA